MFASLRHAPILAALTLALALAAGCGAAAAPPAPPLARNAAAVDGAVSSLSLSGAPRPSVPVVRATRAVDQVVPSAVSAPLVASPPRPTPSPRRAAPTPEQPSAVERIARLAELRAPRLVVRPAATPRPGGAVHAAIIEPPRALPPSHTTEPQEPPPPSVAPPMPRGLEKIQHFVFIMQENRSFDSYFGTYPGADGIPPGVCLPNPRGGPCIAPHHDPSPLNRGGPHDLSDAVADIDGGRMDGFVARAYVEMGRALPVPCPPSRASCAPAADPRDVMGWHDSREIPNYWNYARLYVLQDHMFSSVPSYTLPNRLYLLAGQSGGLLRHAQLRPATFRFPLIVESLTAHGVSWRYYVTSGQRLDPVTGQVIDAPAEQQAVTRFSYFNPLPAFAQVAASPTLRRSIVDTSQFYRDAREGHLPAVAWVAPSEPLSEHPPHDIRLGMAYVTGLVNAVMEGPDWSSTAIFISYDEWGGFYDHVPPPRLGGQEVGLRVPGLVISPYARQGYIDHQIHTPASWLRIVEERFGLPPLTWRDAEADDMIADFDFSQRPRPPVLLAATPEGSPYPHPLQVIQR
ncbi:MAG: alkaline phosphatase family protein [Chloroflexi bacterium]|nr:alkaline phosphatase family protein [Chloroflexota bacterium]